MANSEWMINCLSPGDRLPVRREPGGGQVRGDHSVAAAADGEARGWRPVGVQTRQRAPGQRQAPRH